MEIKTVILGRDYVIREATPGTDPVLVHNDGYCDASVGVCVINALEQREPDSLQDMNAYKRKVMRHEIIHAFLAESGLQGHCDWACKEMVDWLAVQFPKIAGVFSTTGCMDGWKE